jgi:hypothetical protein
MPRFALLLLAIPLTACTPPDPAPLELSDLLGFAWSHYAFDVEGNEVSLADAGINFDAWFAENVEALDDYDAEVGFQASLTEETDRLPDEALTDLDPAPTNAVGQNAVGVVVALHTDCTLEDMDRLYTQDDQLALHPTSYISYERTETFGYDCFQDGSCDEFGWVSNIHNDLVLGAEAHFVLQNQVRRISAQAPDGTQVEARLGRTWMAETARIDPETIGTWSQNYQLEYMFERPDGILHVYPQWVEVVIDGMNTEAGAFLNGYVEGLHEYILEVEEHCIAGR